VATAFTSLTAQLLFADFVVGENINHCNQYTEDEETACRCDEKRHRLYPLSCKIGVWTEKNAAEVARILMHLYD